jgi:antiviral helicase SKI2
LGDLDVHRAVWVTDRKVKSGGTGSDTPWDTTGRDRELQAQIGDKLKSLWAANDTFEVLANGVDWIKERKRPQMDISEAEWMDSWSEMAGTMARMRQHPCTSCPLLQQHSFEMDMRQRLAERLEVIAASLSDKNLMHFPDLESRVRVLEALGYVDAQGTVLLKG